MGTEYLIDSNAVIDFCNGKLPLAGRELLFSIVQPKISVITHIEVFGFPEISRTEEKLLNDFVSIALIYPLDIDVAKKSIEIKKKARIKLPDAVIAATALIHGLVLISRNLADFDKITGLKVLNPHDL